MNAARRPAVSRWRIRLLLVAIAAVLLPAGVATLYAFPPGETRLYPPCMLHLLTGWHCPGCGATRCVAALVHGDLLQALAYNPLLVLGMPLLAMGAAQIIFPLWTGRRWPLPAWPWWMWHVVFWVAVAFGVLRNVPVYPLAPLAPHSL
jgi:Protein of unknown function (DUF2752)